MIGTQTSFIIKLNYEWNCFKGEIKFVIEILLRVNFLWMP